MMRDGHQEFHQLMQRLRAGSPDAAEELLDRYHDDLYRVVRRWLHRRLRTQFDSVDFLQSVWGSFFAIPPEQLQFASPAALRAFLIDLATNKVIDAFRKRLAAQRRNLNREKSLDGSAAMEALSLAAAWPRPSEVAVEREIWDGLVEGLSDSAQTILSMLREGRSHREIARTLSVSERTIYRLIQSLEARRES